MRGLSLVLLAITLTSCSNAPSGPERVALELFRVAEERPLRHDRIDTLFDLRADDPRRVSLLESLDLLREAGRPAVIGTEVLEDLQRTAVDLETRLDAGGVASYTVQLERSGEDWVVRWFGGPGVEWPPVRRRRDQGLSNSAPPPTVAAPDSRARGE